jgi:hypothetical protein
MVKRVMVLVPALAMALGAAPQQQGPRDYVAWAKSWEEAKAEAQERNVPILLTIQQDENPGCVQMEGAFRDSSFILQSRRVVCVVSNGDTKHGVREVYVNKVKTAMCKAYDGIMCEAHLACQRAMDGIFKEGNFDIPTQVWCKPDGTELFKITGSGGNGAGAQSSSNMIRDMDKALDRISGPHMNRTEWEAVKQLLKEGQEAEGKQEWKIALAIYKKVKEVKWEKFAKQGESNYDGLVQNGVRIVERAKKQYDKTDKPELKKESKTLIQKIAKEMKGTAAGEAAEKVLKELK